MVEYRCFSGASSCGGSNGEKLTALAADGWRVVASSMRYDGVITWTLERNLVGVRMTLEGSFDE